MTMPKFPFKRDDHYIWRSVTGPGTATVMGTTMVPATPIDVYGLRWEWPGGRWWEWHFSSRRVER